MHHSGSTTTMEETLTNILNIQSQFNEVEIRKAKQRPIRHQLIETPNMVELTEAIGKLKNRMAGAAYGILPEMQNAVRVISLNCYWI